MGKKLFILFFIFIVIGSAILLNQYAPVPVPNATTSSPLPTATSSSSDLVPETAKNITVTSFPADASVFLDNVQVGKTPVTLAQLSGEKYALKIEKAGFVVYTATLIPSENDGLIAVTLSPNSPSDPLIITPSTIDDDNINDLVTNDPQIPTELLGLVTVPTGYRFPLESQDITKRINLEIIPLAVAQELAGIVRSDLIARLANLYHYDPQSIEIKLDDTFVPTNIVLFDGQSYDPARNKISSGETTIWYNHTETTCQLRTDPQSPIKINQLVPPQKAFPMILSEKGIYIFYCQGQPGPTHTLVVS